MDLQDTLDSMCCIKKTARTLEAVACRQKIMATLYDTYFPGAEVLRGPISNALTATFSRLMAFGLIGKDSELAGYKLIKA